jgi:hypothetical protein
MKATPSSTSVRLRHAALIALSSWSVLWGCASEHRPDSFGDACKTDAECKAPYSCIATRVAETSKASLTCTRACQTDQDCPDWDDEDDCAEGFRNSRCVAAVCTLRICEG